jgi:hypothetical protein
LMILVYSSSQAKHIAPAQMKFLFLVSKPLYLLLLIYFSIIE